LRDEVWGRRDSARWACSAGNTNCSLEF